MIESRWRVQNYDDAAFPDIAYEALCERPAYAEVDPMEPLQWLLGDSEFPDPVDPDGHFGQPPITVYGNPRFVIDVLYWLESTTAIHDHGFSGAFQVLTGSSVHSEWDFLLEDAVTSAFQIGQVVLKDSELLNPGDCRRILAGTQFRHSLFHLDHPSATVVVRTRAELETITQRDYQPPHLAVTSFRRDPRVRWRIGALKTMRALDRSRFQESFRAALAELDLQTAFEAIRQLTPLWEREELHAALDAARQRHGQRVDALLPVLEETDRQLRIQSLRGGISSAEHRFFLALALNAPNRDAVLKLVASRHPEAPPGETILRWIRELGAMNSDEAKALGLALDANSSLFLRQLLTDVALPKVVHLVRREVDSLREAFARHPLLRILFA
jgi:hypothetical protein